MTHQPPNHSVPSDAVTAAIVKSRDSLDDFVAAFRRRARAQSDFMVVVLENEEQTCLPVGILVDEIGNGTFAGRRVANTLRAEPTARTSCRWIDVVDWRYIDAFEMEGGVLYRELYQRLHGIEKFTIRDEQPFVIEREGDEQKIDRRMLQIFRDIANGRSHRLEQLSSEELAFSGIKAPMPERRFVIGQSFFVFPFSIPEYAAMYGDEDIIDLLAEHGVLEEEPERFSPLASSSAAGNLETTSALLALGFNPESFEGAPLYNAIVCDHLAIVRLLLESGADCNARGTSDDTPLFHAQSVEVAKALIDAGADVNAINDSGMTCLDVHLFHCRNAMTFDREIAIVRLLLEHGAQHNEPLVEEPPPNAETILSDSATHGNAAAARLLESFAVADAVDFGCVLPVRSLPKSALIGIMPTD